MGRNSIINSLIGPPGISGDGAKVRRADRLDLAMILTDRLTGYITT